MGDNSVTHPDQSVEQFDPRDWILAAGELEKQRDGSMRVGWSKRFFVLTESTLYYYRAPKLDQKGTQASLLGEERGLVRLRNITDMVCCEADKDGYWILRFKIKHGKLKKPIGSSTFAPAVETLVLRCRSEDTCIAWKDALNNSLARIREMPETARQQKRFSSEYHSDEDRGNSGEELMWTQKVKRNLSTGSNQRDGFRGTGLRKRNFDKRLGARAFGSEADGGHASDTSDSASPSHKLGTRGTRYNTMLAPLQEQPKLPKGEHLNFGFVIAALVAVNALWYTETMKCDVVAMGIFNSMLLVAVVLIEQRAKSQDVVVQLANQHFNNLVKATTQLERFSLDNSLGTEEAHEEVVCEKLFTAGATGISGVIGDLKWSNGTGPSFNTRIGPNYPKNKKKSTSADSMYDAVGFDMVRSTASKVDHIATQVDLPPVRECDDLETIKASGLPRIIIVNIQVPLSGGDESDPGISCVMYFALKPEVAKVASELGSAPPCVKLLHRFCNNWRTDEDVRRRFKGIANMDNIGDLGFIIRSFSKYNGKPVIIYKAGELYEGDGYLEIDVSIYKFNAFCRKAIATLKKTIPSMKIEGGFCIQAEADEEMPETMMGSIKIENMDFDEAKVIAGL